MELFVFLSKFHWDMFAVVHFTISQQWFGLVPSRRQAIIWTKGGLVYWHIYVAFDLNVLTTPYWMTSHGCYSISNRHVHRHVAHQLVQVYFKGTWNFRITGILQEESTRHQWIRIPIEKKQVILTAFSGMASFCYTKVHECNVVVVYG